MLNTLGDVVTCGMALFAVLVIPAAIIRRWWPVLRAQLASMFVMSHEQEAAPRSADMEAVYIPVSHTDMVGGMEPEAHDITDDWEMPRIGRRLTDDEIITVLATQKGVDGVKYRFSANDIAQIMKGDRNTRLDQVRSIREGPPAPQVRDHQAKLEQLQAPHIR